MQTRRNKFLAPVVVAAVLSASVSFPQIAFAVEQDWFVDDGPSVTCDDAGTEADPFQSVQCAIDAATPGDTVRVMSGTYSGFAVTKALTVVGPNAGVAPGPGATRQAEAVITSPVRIASAVDGATISGFSLSSTNSEDVGLSVESNSRNVTIAYNEITGFDQGIRSEGNNVNFGSGMNVSSNYIHGLSLGSTGSFAIHLRNVKNVTVSDNIITDSVTSPVLNASQFRRGIVLRGTENAVASGNTVDFGLVASSKASYGISIVQLLNDGKYGSDLPVANVEISDNTFSGVATGVNFLDLNSQATNVVIERNTARNVFAGVTFKSFGQTSATTVQELLVEKNDFSQVESRAGTISAGVQVFSIDVTAPATNEFDGVVVQGNKLPSNTINQVSEINGLMVGAINPFAAGFPNVLTFYATDITDLDARANYWGGQAPTTDNTRQANVAGSILGFTDDPTKTGQAGFWPSCSSLQVAGVSSVDVQALYECPLGAPGTPTAVAGNGRATISWTAPSTGAGPFTYTVSSNPEGAACVVDGLTALCTGLSNLTPYTFTVTATNTSGSAVSSASVAIQSTPEEWFVDDGPSGTCSDAGTALDPFQSVQCAISAATSGDTIRVAAGEYAGFTVNKPLTILGPKAATSPAASDDASASWGDASGWAVVKASSGRVIQVTAAADGTVIKGLAITSTNGSVTPAANGVLGIDLLGPDNITIQNNYFYDLYNVAITSSGAPATPRASSYLIDSNLIASAKGPFESRGSYYGTEVAAVNPWYVNDLTFSNNRIFGYGRGVQLEQNSGAVVRSNYISDIFYHGIQAANGQSNTLIEGNTVDRAQMGAYYEYFYGGYCSGAIRLWTVDTSSGFVVRNNLVSNTGATQRTGIADDYRDLCPAIALNGSNSAAVSSITDNSISNASNRSGSTNPGLGIVWTANQVVSAAVSGGTATVRTFGANSLATGDVVTIANLGAPFDGSWTVTKSGTRTVTFAIPGAANVSRGQAAGGGYNAPSEATAIVASAGATIVRTSSPTQVGAISASNNWWGSAGGTGTVGSTVNAGGSAVTSSLNISSYVNDSTKSGQPGFWPTMVNVPSAPGTPTATAGNGRATISWTEPTFGAAPFTYTITSNPEGAACVVDGLTALCTGLTNYTSYTFTVTATNTIGSAVSSDSVAVEGVDQDWFVDDGPSVACNDLGTEADPFQSVPCAISAATSGETIRVKAGTYAGFAVNKALIILGPNDEVAPGPGIERSPEAVIESAVSISSALDGVTLSGFSLAPTSAAGVGVGVGSNTENVSITYNDISGFDQGIRSEGNAGNFGSNMDVSYNYIHGLSLASFGSYAIHLRNVKNLTVSDNIVTDSVTDPVLTGSQMRRGIVLRGAQDAVVSNNTVDFGSAASTRAYYAISIAQLLNDGVNGNDISVSNVQITGNTLSGAVNGINFLDLGSQATNVEIEGNTARDVFVGVSFKSFGQTSATVVDELVVQRNDFSNIDSALGVLSAGVQVYSIDFTQPATNEFDGVVVNGNKLPSNKINQLSQINGLMVGAINPFAAGFPNVLTFYATDITDLDARANFWGGEAPTTDIARQANVAGAMLTGSYSDDPSKAGQPGFWPLSTDANLADLSLSTGTLTPVFASDTTNYTVRVPASFTSFAVTPTKSDTKASMAQFVGASGTTPFTGELGGRETIIRVVVTAEDGTTKTYKVTVTRFNFTPQIITFTPVASITATTATYALVASANSGLPVAFASTTNEICTVSGTTLTPVKAGLCVITASQAGNDTFYAPASVNKSIVITRAAQSITGLNPSAMTTLSSPQTLSATKGLGSAPVTFSTNSSGVCSIVGTSLTVVAPGTCVVTASQAEDSRYAAASVMKSITITKVAQSITGFNPSAMTTLSSPQTLGATKGPGSAPVTFSTNSSGVCSIDGTSLTAVAAGTCVVTASQAEDGRYAAANNVTKSITISKAAQTIAFTPVASLSAAAPSYALTATAGVGATVAFASTTPLVCTVSGTTLTPVKAGTCSITASQVGNATYLAATNVSKSITINLASQATLTVSNSTKFAFKKGVPVTLTSSGGSGTGNAVTFSVRGTGCSISSGALTVATTTRPGSLVSCSVTATRAGNAIYLPATSTATNFFFQNR